MKKEDAKTLHPAAQEKKRKTAIRLLKQKALSHLRKLQKLPKWVASYFQAESIQYAAA
ncbi:hypothetical protein [Thiorhodospira sibirica]|uniref:hypothetical protein n=1 Tax=Thiorhodospira sibirica TaxID=154347 RepID=UPI0003047D30|nr:hypothetical protein [Thiorhodospira sibirica]